MNNIHKEQNMYGSISVSEGVIYKLIENIFSEYNGKIFLANSKGKKSMNVYNSVRGVNSSGINVVETDEGTTIKLFVVLKFGMSIKETTDLLCEKIRSAFYDMMGYNPRRITIQVTGVLSRKLARRNIEIEQVYNVECGN